MSIYDKVTLLGAVRQMERPHTFLRDTFFPRFATSPNEKIEIDMVKGNRKVAPFVHPVRGGKVMENEGYATESYKAPLVAPEKIIRASDLNKRLPGEDPYGATSPDDRAAAQMASNLEEMEDAITRREEVMCAQAIFNGQIHVKGDGLDEVIDFGLKNKIKVAILWNNPSSDKLADIKAAYEKVQEEGYVNPGICIMGKNAVKEFLNDEKVQKLLDVKNINLAKIEPKKLPNGATFIGRINELDLDIYTYNAMYFDDFTDPDVPKNKYFVPENKFALLPMNADYYMAYGAVETVDEETGDVALTEGMRVPDSYVLRKPARKVVNLSSRPLPIPSKADSWAVVEVL